MTGDGQRTRESEQSSSETSDALVLSDHHLSHISRLTVDPSVFERRFSASCSMANCQGVCCRSGVWVDAAHRERIEQHADVVVRYMEPDQEHDPARWFDEDETLVDRDFESGSATSTSTRNGSCVFLDSRRRCVLQLAQAEVPGLKPFYCFAYPIVIDHGVLTLDDEHCPDEMRCCAAMPGGSQNVFDVCGWELEHVLGSSGYEELRRLAMARSTVLPNDTNAS
jgi:Fe-S-cluster containining protein